ncbi:MAG TPA: ABC transporter permease [Gemmatimonadaceae bacterium]|nr:ABC transporter permease [Gemmatimonadaceae bacterium]
MDATSFGSDLVRDVRLGWRALVRTPGFAIPAVTALALGLALLATTLGVVNAYLIRSLPYPAAARLYHVVYAPVGIPEPRGISAMDWRALADVVEFADSSASTRFLVTNGGATEEVFGVLAAPQTIGAYGVRVAFGRGFVPDDLRTGAERVALIGHSYWRARFAGDSNVVGRRFLASSVADTAPPGTYRIIGVLSGEYRDARGYARGVVDVVTPMREHYRTYVVRLRDGVSPAVAERRLTDAVRGVATTLPDRWRGVKLESLDERYSRSLRPVLVAVTFAALLVLLIVCANVAVLMLLRALRRQTEIAVRVALGASTLQIFRSVAIESGLLSGVAVLTAFGISAAALAVVAPHIEIALGQPVPRGAAALRIDPSVAAIVVALGILTAITLSAIPLLAPWRHRLAEALRRGGRGATDSATTRRLRAGLLATQMAVSVALTVGCGLTIRSALHLVRTDLGIDTHNVLRSRLVPPRRAYQDSVTLTRLNDRVVTALRKRYADRVAFSSFPVLLETTPATIESQGTPGRGLDAGSMAVSTNFFPLFGVRILSGRNFADTDRGTSQPVAIISETLARRLFTGTDALGQRIRIMERQGGGDNPAAALRTVVAIVSDVRQASTDEDLSDVYVPFFQAASRYTSVYVRTSAPYENVFDSLRDVVGRIDSRILVGASSSLDVVVHRQLGGAKFLAGVLTTFAIVATMLAVFGNYAVVAYAVEQREREIAIRIALGATPRTLMRIFLRQAMVVVGIGVTIGAVGALGVGRVLRAQLHGVSPFDPGTVAIACLAIGVAALICVWRPARHATTINPATSLNDA